MKEATMTMIGRIYLEAKEEDVMGKPFIVNQL